MLKGFYPFFALLAIGLVLVIFSGSIARWFAANRADYNGQIIGVITHPEGSVRRIHLSDIELIPSPMPLPIDLNDGDGLQSSVSSKADFALNNGDHLELLPGSALKLKLLNPKDLKSPVLVIVQFGKVNSGESHPPGKTFLIQDGLLYFSGQHLSEKPLGMTLAKSPLAAESEYYNYPAQDEIIPSDLKYTLSNEYLDAAIGLRQMQLQKCWRAALKKNPEVKGQFAVQFSIRENGEVEKLQIADATFEEEDLKKCVSDIIAHIPFQKYSGQEMQIKYPIGFE